MSWRWSRGMKEVRQQAPQVPREGLPGRRKEECKALSWAIMEPPRTRWPMWLKLSEPEGLWRVSGRKGRSWGGRAQPGLEGR